MKVLFYYSVRIDGNILSPTIFAISLAVCKIMTPEFTYFRAVQK